MDEPANLLLTSGWRKNTGNNTIHHWCHLLAVSSIILTWLFDKKMFCKIVAQTYKNGSKCDFCLIQEQCDVLGSSLYLHFKRVVWLEVNDWIWFCCSANEKKNECDFFIWTMHKPKGWVHCDVQKSKDKCIDFCHLHVNKLIIISH